MRGGVGEGGGKVALRLGERLLRERVHEVDVPRIEMARGLFDGGVGLLAIVDAAKLLEVLVIEALDAHGESGDACVTKGGEAGRFDGAGVGF